MTLHRHGGVISAVIGDQANFAPHQVLSLENCIYNAVVMPHTAPGMKVKRDILELFQSQPNTMLTSNDTRGE